MCKENPEYAIIKKFRILLIHTLYYVTLKAELNSVVKIKAEKKVDSSKV